jgi:tRNA-Thr(GGU) m(6)t(6)A37 methyltransferase TsaA
MAEDRGRVEFRFVGYVRSPYRDLRESLPPQPSHGKGVEGEVVIFPEFRECLRGLENFRWVFLITYLNRSSGERTLVRPRYAPDKVVGVFASRSPDRPNPIGVSLVRFLRSTEAGFEFCGVDLLDSTPVLDIKPCFCGGKPLMWNGGDE